MSSDTPPCDDEEPIIVTDELSAVDYREALSQLTEQFFDDGGSPDVALDALQIQTEVVRSQAAGPQRSHTVVDEHAVYGDTPTRGVGWYVDERSR